MSNYNFDLEFACSSCNCNPGCFSWLQPPNQPDRSGSLLVFGAGCFLALAEVTPDAVSPPPRVLSYASNHTGLVYECAPCPQLFLAYLLPHFSFFAITHITRVNIGRQERLRVGAR